MHVLITGGTGLIGTALANALLKRGDQVTVLTRFPTHYKDTPIQDYIRDLDELKAPVDAVVNLAGEPIAAKRWSDQRKQQLLRSRVDTTEALIQWMQRTPQRPHVLISGSAIGYYGNRSDDLVLDETAPIEPGFTHELCSEWEQTALRAMELNVRTCLIRTGVVLSKRGGALQQMLPAYKLGLGGRIASGTQWFAWIHEEDEVGAILHLLDHSELSGAFNLTAPQPVTNAAFSQQLADALHRPSMMVIPACALKLMMGESAQMLIQGQRVVPAALQQAGYQFIYPELNQALNQIFAR